MNNNYPLQIQNEINNSGNYYIVFTVNENQYAINIKNIIEIINIPQIDIPEHAPKGIIGMFNYNGIMIKTVDICPFLGFDTPSFSITNQIIIAVVDNNCFAVHTEKIDNITQFEINNIQKIPYESSKSILTQVYKSEEQSVNIIDINVLHKLISENSVVDSSINYRNLFPVDEKSTQILKLRANQHKIVQDVFSFPVNINAVNQYILFTIDNQNYYMDLRYVKEFISIKRLNITKLPYTQNFIKGIINIRGEFLTVIDLKHFLNNQESSIQEGSKLIITEGKDYNVAFLVDDIKYIKNLNNISSSSVSHNNNAYITFEFMEEGKLYSILNYDKIINDERLYINIV